MPFGENSYRPKTQQELNQQITSADETLANTPENSLVPPLLMREDVLSMPLEEIKTKYARRYEMYLRLLRHNRQTETSELKEEDSKTMKKWLTALNSLDTYISKYNSGEEHTLKERQLTVFEDLRNFIEAGGATGYIKLPTGVGKTVLFIEFIEALNLKTIIVVPTNVLVEQTEEKLSQFAPEIGVGKVAGGTKHFGQQVTIATYDSFVQKVADGQLNANDCECLILDEAHLSLSPKRQETVANFDTSLKLGFTATPEFSSQKKVSDLLGAEIHHMSIREAIEKEGLLSSFSSIIARTNTDLSGVTLNNNGEYNAEELARAVNIAGRNKAAVDLYKQAFHGQSAIAYCVGVEHADMVANLFIQEGILAVAISGKTPAVEQQKILEKFARGEIKIICNAELLVTGFDEPKASVCLNLRPTRSRVMCEQRGGRVLRLDQTNLNKEATIVDFLDEGAEETKLPVLFADIADGATIIQKGKNNGNGRSGGTGKKTTPILDIQGIEVIIDTEEILKIVNNNRIKEEKKELLNFQELQKDIKKAGVTTSTQYKVEQKKHSNWPSNPNLHYPDWPTGGWYILLSRERKQFLSFTDFQKEVRKIGVMRMEQYKIEQKKHSDWPSNPKATYETDWPAGGWKEFLGTQFISFSELQNEVKKAEIRNLGQYKAIYRQHAGWPVDPAVFYKSEWPTGGWPEFLGKFLSFADLQKEVNEVKIKSQLHYLEVYKKHPGWPSQPKSYYPEWPTGGWYKFLSKEAKEFLSFTDFQKEVRKVGVMRMEQYKIEQKKHSNWPCTPEATYETDWPAGGWKEFLGTQFISFSELQNEVKKAEIRNLGQYKAIYRQHAGWPASPSAFYKSEWPTGGWPEFLGKK